MTALLMTYERLKMDELRGTSQADYLVSLDADFQIRQGDAVLYQEPYVPVVELARSLLIWLDDVRRGDFQFESMSFDEVGSVTIRRTPLGWVFDSVFSAGGSSTPVGWAEVDRCSRERVARVEGDLLALGLRPDEVIKR